jgi:hypothetical protein
MSHKIAALVLVAFLAAGCSGGGAADRVAAPTPTTPAAPRYASVIALRDAVVKAGYPCPSWNLQEGPQYAKEVGACSDDDVFSVYATDADVQSQLQMSKAAGINLLVGPNWMINIPPQYLVRVQAGIGGEYVAAGEALEPEPSETASAEDEIDKSDIKLTIKTRSKKCYGYGVGCSIEYRIEVAAADRTGWPKDGTLDVTYEVTGGQDGPDRDTLTIDLTEWTYEQDGYQSADTSFSGVKLKASVVELEYSEW